MPAPYEKIAEQKRAVRSSLIPSEWKLPVLAGTSNSVTSIPASCGLLSELELDITQNHSAEQIVDGCVTKKWSAEEIAIAFCKRAAIAQQLTNCLTEIFFDAALERARYLDAHLAKHKKPLGPFHGLPISLKDPFSIKGLDSSIGLCGMANKPAEKNVPLVDMLLEAGAVLYVKTTTPQGQLSFDTDSPLWGRTVNPHNINLTAGGSSGGEGALLAMSGSPLGIGTDLGGSVRIPASFCGVYGLKPSTGRIPIKGTDSLETPGTEGPITAAVGPLGRSVSDIEFFMRTMQSLSPWKYEASVLKYNLEFPAWGKKLTFGFLPGHSDGSMHPHPPIVSLLDALQKALPSAGHSVKSVNLPSLPRVYATTNQLFSHAGSQNLFAVLEEVQEPLSPWLAARMRPRAAGDLASLVKIQAKRHELQAQILKEWAASDVDVLVIPTAGHAASPHDKFSGANFTSIWSTLDYPAGVLPGRKVTELDLQQEMGISSLGRWDDANRALWAAEKRQAFLGAPIGVQVVAKRGEEGQCIFAMRVVDELLKDHRPKL